MNDFTLLQIRDLYGQHTKATAQCFEATALEAVYQNTLGQPWLVNALGRELCFGKHALPHEHTITPVDVHNAIEILIQRRDVHLDQLTDKITEPRVERVIQAILLGETSRDADITAEDSQYLLDLGLIRNGVYGLEIANPIYREVIPRELTIVEEKMLGQNPAWYIKGDGKLDIDLLLERMIYFYKENGEMITQRKTYNEAAHHLVFMAWVHRVVNSGGRVQREYAAGLKRLDLLIEFAGERFAFELKLNSGRAIDEGKVQLTEYLNRLGLDFGRLLIFNRPSPQDWNALGKRESFKENDKTIEIIWL